MVFLSIEFRVLGAGFRALGIRLKGFRFKLSNLRCRLRTSEWQVAGIYIGSGVLVP